jgi:hypothetical protein
VAPVEVSVLVTLPLAHSVHEEDPLLLAKEPASHAWHSCVEEAEYLPTLQGVQSEAPGVTRVFVTLPALHAMQVMVESIVYVPALQVVHEVAPTTDNVLVTLPAKQI